MLTTSFSVREILIPLRLEDEVIVRSNGMPNYNLTSIIDDAEMRITHVIRGTEHLNNTPKQIAIANALGLEISDNSRTSHWC